MNVMILDISDDINMLVPIGREWATAAHGAEYGLPIDVDIAKATMHQLQMRSDGDVLVLMDGDQVRGFMGLSYQPNHVGSGLIANECLFYVDQSARSGGIKLIHSARKLAKIKGCNFFFLNASRVAGDGDRSGALYERLGFKHFESSYMAVL